MKKVAFLGRKYVATECFKRLLELRQAGEVEIVGVLSAPHVLDGDQSVPGLCAQAGVPLLATLEEYLALPAVDILFSVQFERILNARQLAKASECNVNLHMAPVPEYRGCNQFSWAILDHATEFGTTLHVMDEGIDHGDILFEKRFPIPRDCWVEDLYAMTVDASVALFADSVAPIVSGHYGRTPQASLRGRSASLHFRDDIRQIKKIDLSWDAQRIHAHVRAASMPGFPPPYYVADGEQHALVASRYTLAHGRLAHHPTDTKQRTEP